MAARPRIVSDDEILEAARRCFLKHGWAVSTVAIADDLGISHAVLFRRFKTKEALFKAAFAAPDTLPWEALLSRPLVARSARLQIHELVEAIHHDFAVSMPRIALVKSSGFGLRDVCRSGQEPPPVRARRLLVEWFEQARDQGVVRKASCPHVVDILLGALSRRPFMEYVTQKKFGVQENKEYIDAVCEVVCLAIDPFLERPVDGSMH